MVAQCFSISTASPGAPQTYNPVFTFTPNACVAGSDQTKPVLYGEIEVFNRALSQYEIQVIGSGLQFDAARLRMRETSLCLNVSRCGCSFRSSFTHKNGGEGS